MRKVILLLLILVPILIVGFFVRNIYQLTLSNCIYTGQDTAMEDPEIVVVRSTHFHKKDHIYGQFLQSVFLRLQNKKDVSESVMVTDTRGKVVLNKTLNPYIVSNVINLDELQRKADKYDIKWYWNKKILAATSITIVS